MFTSSMLMGGGNKKKTIDDLYASTIYTGAPINFTGAIPVQFDMRKDGGMIWNLPLQAVGRRILEDTESSPNKYSGGTAITTYGTDAYLVTNTTAAQVTTSGIGLDVQADNYNWSTSDAAMNTFNNAYLTRAFKKEKKFFDAVPYTGTGTGAKTVFHNLGVVPGMIIIKRINAVGNWIVWHKDFSDDNIAYLDTTAVNTTTLSGLMTVFDNRFVAYGSAIHNILNADYIAYLFAHDDSPDSVIKCGSYTGNGSSAGPTIDLGWEPQFLLIKKFTGNTTAANWIVYDNAMPGYRTVLNGTAIPVKDLFLSINPSGFGITTTNNDLNINGSNYAYMAIRKSDNPIADPEGVSLGDPFGGGYYGGIIRTGAEYYWIVVAPKATGETTTTVAWRTTANSTPGALSINDGWKNTKAMMDENPDLYPAGKFCHDLSIGGFVDWYLPSQDELELLYYNFRPSTTAPSTSYGINWSANPPRPINHTSAVPPRTSLISYQTSGSEVFEASPAYWSSTEATIATSYAMYQLFSNGQATYGIKTNPYKARAIRRIKIPAKITQTVDVGENYGGYYMGDMIDGSIEYKLIAAPKSLGQNNSILLKTTATATPNTDSETNGFSNTLAMIAAGAGTHPAAEFCRGLTIGGYTDWYLPAKDELNLCYVNRNKISYLSEKFDSAWYWASTGSDSDDSMNWLQNFDDGMQYPDAKNLNSPVRAVRKIITSISNPPGINIGDAYNGGYYAGIIGVGSDWYYLIVAPAAAGGPENTGRQWKITGDATTGTNSINDGWANTLAMIAAGAGTHPAAEFCRGLTIGGYTDWYLPAKDELEILYSVFKPNTTNNNTSSGINPSSYPAKTTNYTASVPSQTEVTAFLSGGSGLFWNNYYWSSTENSTTNSFGQMFNGGAQIGLDKTNSLYARAVRREKIV